VPRLAGWEDASVILEPGILPLYHAYFFVFLKSVQDDVLFSIVGNEACKWFCASVALSEGAKYCVSTRLNDDVTKISYTSR
jgi:hypothetical protein